MEAVVEALNWVRAHPFLSVAGIVAAMAAYGYAQRKPRIFREADREFDRLREQRGRSYDKTRPLE